jgi:hypothetical protein
MIFIEGRASAFGRLLHPTFRLWNFSRKEGAMSFGLYAAGFVIMLCGLIYGAHLMHIPPRWIGVGAIVMFGIGILSAVKATRQKDPS